MDEYEKKVEAIAELCAERFPGLTIITPWIWKMIIRFILKQWYNNLF